MTRAKPPITPPSSSKKAPVPAKSAGTRKRIADDEILWEHVAASITPLKGKRKTTKETSAPTPPRTTAPVGKKPAVSKAKAAPMATPQRSTREVASRTAAPAPAAPRTTAGFDRATETKLRKGQLEIEGRIDLHGMTQDEAYRALSRFVIRAHAQHKRTVLVITGKGRLSQGGGVLRRLLPMWVAQADLKSCVLACTPAATKDGGDGAFYLRLRKHKE